MSRGNRANNRGARSAQSSPGPVLSDQAVQPAPAAILTDVLKSQRHALEGVRMNPIGLSLTDAIGYDSEADFDATPAGTAVAIADDDTRVVMIEVPLLVRDVYVGRKLRDLEYRNAATLTSMMNALAADRVKLESGRIVQTPDDALVWLLEHIAQCSV